jgi:SAM-dependent methyltransferase
VGKLPEEGDSRWARLERWAAEQLARDEQRAAEQRALVQQRAVEERLRRERWAAGQVRIDRTRGMLVSRFYGYVDRLLDRGLDTFEPVFDIPERRAVDGQEYLPSAWHVLPRALRAVGASERDVLLDFGCGKGRIVHQAARRRLGGVIGVEVSPELAELARALVAAQRDQYRCPRVEIVLCDAARFRVPDEVTIAFLADSFRGNTLDRVLGNLIKSIDRRPRKVRLIYVHPMCGDQVLATGRFRLARWQRGGLRDVRLSRAAIFESCS